jgi:hypothetical protein
VISVFLVFVVTHIANQQRVVLLWVEQTHLVHACLLMQIL